MSFSVIAHALWSYVHNVQDAAVGRFVDSDLIIRGLHIPLDDLPLIFQQIMVRPLKVKPFFGVPPPAAQHHVVHNIRAIVGLL